MNNFLKSISKNAEMLILASKKSLDNVFSDLMKYDSQSTLSKAIFQFYRNYEYFANKIKSSIELMEKDLIEPIGLFHKHLMGKNNEMLNDFKNIVNIVYENKRSLERFKHKYFDACKLAHEQENYVLKVVNDKENNKATDEEINVAHETLLKYRTMAENNAQLYKSELARVNKIYEECENSYNPLVEKIKGQEESRVYFLKCHMEKFSQIISDFNSTVNEFVERLNTSLIEIQTEEDLKYFDTKFKYRRNDKNRIPREEFLNYDIYRRNLEALVNAQSFVSKGNTLTKFIDTTNNIIFNQQLSFSDEFEFVEKSPGEKMIIDFIKKIYSLEEISVELVKNIVDKMYKDTNFAKLFIDELILRERRNICVKFENHNNLLHFAHIINCLSDIFNDNREKLFELNFAIIFIAERAFYINQNDIFDKIYLCSIISQNKTFSKKKFWKELMELKITRKIEEKVVQYCKANNIDDYSKEKGGILNIGSRVKGMFFNNKESKNKKIENEIIYSKIREKVQNDEVFAVIKEFIPHFTNFRYEVAEAFDIIVELANKYDLCKEKITYFISSINSNLFTIKRTIPKPKTIQFENNAHLSREKPFDYYQKLNDQRLSTLIFSSKYLKLVDTFKLLQINKVYNSKLRKIVFKNIFSKNLYIGLENRMKIWGALLKINETKKNYNYLQILKETEDAAIFDPNITYMIGLDVQRTYFEDDVEGKRNAISNILQAVAHKAPHINYCQGMNYIAAFLICMIKDEEETFYFMLALLLNTPFGKIYEKELANLKQYFYVFDRLVYLYVPEVSNYFRINSIHNSFFSSSWFITLFTNSFQHITDENPRVLLKIWDEFILNGWKAILKVGITLLKQFEDSILQLKFEELLQFLINEVLKSIFFQNENYEKFLFIYNNLKITNGLISNLENEYVLDFEIKNIIDEEKQKMEREEIIRKEKEKAINI